MKATLALKSPSQMVPPSKHSSPWPKRRGGNISAFDDPAFHKPGATHEIKAKQSGYIAAMDTTALGWAVQRLGAGRGKG